MTRDGWSCPNPKPLGHTYLKLNVNYRIFFYVSYTHRKYPYNLKG